MTVKIQIMKLTMLQSMTGRGKTAKTLILIKAGRMKYIFRRE